MKQMGILRLPALLVLFTSLTAAVAQPSHVDDLPANVPADWWGEVSRSIQLEEYRIDRSGAAELIARNPAQRFESRFDVDGVALRSTEDAGWRWGLALRSWGRPGEAEVARAGRMESSENRIDLHRGDLVEWFINTPQGLEHGFTVPLSPEATGNELVFDLAFRGSLRPVFAADGQAIDLFAGGVSVLRYDKLVVTDATGRRLPSRMQPIPGGVRIVVEDGNAVYPILVDPLATSASWTAVGEGTDNTFGESVSTAGDVNGDGYVDVIVGARGFNVGAGKAYLFSGGPSGLSTNPSWTVTGSASLELIGALVSAAGDVNGDGFADVLVAAIGMGTVYAYLGSASGLATDPAWSFTGAPFTDFGDSFATAGDVNGDGYSDVVIGATAAGNGGTAFLYLGSAAGLSATPSWTASSETAFDNFGTAVATAGDVNGDGFSDVVVGADGDNGRTGKAYLYLGGPHGLASAPVWTAVGAASFDRFGSTVSTAGDVDGDGYADVAVGAWGGNKVHLFQGSVVGLATSAAWTATGENLFDEFGWSVATAGDVNCDGYSDVIVGASYHMTMGKTYLYLGGSDGLTTSAAWTADGEAPEDRFGHSVFTAGDVNNDGCSDVIIGARDHGLNNIGKAYFYLGGPEGPTATATYSFSGEANDDNFGFATSRADVNGDGFDDVIVGAGGNNNSTGKVYVYLGSSNGPASNPIWTTVGETTGDRFGDAVAGAGDLNGDGYEDLIIGAWRHNGDSGKAYVYLSRNGSLAPSPSWTLAGESSTDFLGFAVAGAGDTNGDGYGDILLSAYGSGSNRGKAHLYLGGGSGPTRNSSWTVEGEASGDDFGLSLAAAGDLDGDGYADVVIGAPGRAGGTGKAYTYLGQASGLRTNASWTAVGEAPSDAFGISVSSAGDVNRDGYGELAVGARGNNNGTGKAYVYMGGFGGPTTSATWTMVGQISGDLFGTKVSSAGDVNGDGYSDLLVGSFQNDLAGRADLFLGSAVGPPSSASWSKTGEAASDFFAESAVAGDVNGDGFSDLILGARGNNGSTGRSYVHLGGGGGILFLPRQLRSDLTAPIVAGGVAFDQAFSLRATLAGPVGGLRRLEWQIATLGLPFGPTQSDSQWFPRPVTRTIPITLTENAQRYSWRARVAYDPAQSPFLASSRWFTLSANGPRETDVLSTSQSTCTAPDEEVYVSTITTDGNGKPVLHIQDPNQPADATGYNVYRTDNLRGPWQLLGSNVVDMDAGTPNIQYVDQTGDAGGPWFYQVAATNGSCDAEGPW